MNKEEYIDHELRIRMMEILYKQLNTKMNALITISLSALIVPSILKYLGI